MPNALMPDTSSYADPTGNALLARGWDGNQALQQVQGLQQIQSNKIAMDQQYYELHKSKFSNLMNAAKSIQLNPTADNATNIVGLMAKAGLVDPDTGTQFLTKIASFNNDPKGISDYAGTLISTLNSQEQQLDAAYGKTATLNTGGQTVGVNLRAPSAAGPGGMSQMGSPGIANTTTPGEKIGAGRTVTDSNGGQTYVPGSKLYDDQGNYVGGGAGGGDSTDYYGSLARGTGAPPPLVGGNKAPPVPSGAMPRASAVAPPAGQGQGAPAPAPAAGPAGQGAPTAAAPGPGPAAAPAGTPGAMMTPTPQSLPVITRDQASAAFDTYQAGKSSAVDRNLLRGYAIQNGGTLKNLGAFEPQPSGVGAGVVVPPQPVRAPQAAGPGGAPAGSAVSSAAPPPAPVQAAGQAPGAGQGGPNAGSGIGRDGMTVSLSPGQQASLTAGAGGYSALSADVSTPTGVSQRVFQLRTALGALRNTQTGLGTAQRQQLVGYMASLPGGLDKWMPGIDPDSATNYDVATKYLNAYALNTPGAARSDAGLSTAQSANANTSGMMQKAAQDVTLSNIGLEVGKRALLNSFEKSGADPGTFNKFAAQWSQGTDPRAFALGDMTPGERATLFSSLQGQQRTNFLATVRKGIAANVISKSDLVGATGGQ